MFCFIFYHSFLYDSNTEHAILSFFINIVDIQLQCYTDNNNIALDLIDIAQFICQILKKSHFSTFNSLPVCILQIDSISPTVTTDCPPHTLTGISQIFTQMLNLTQGSWNL